VDFRTPSSQSRSIWPHAAFTDRVDVTYHPNDV
jgi:hypothetical protein